MITIIRVPVVVTAVAVRLVVTITCAALMVVTLLLLMHRVVTPEPLPLREGHTGATKRLVQ